MKKYTDELKEGMPVQYVCSLGVVRFNVYPKPNVTMVYHDNEWLEYTPNQEVKQMCFTPKVGEEFARVIPCGIGGDFYYQLVERHIDDMGTCSTPCLRPEYADDIMEVLDVVWKAKAAKGALRICDLVDDKHYYYISQEGNYDWFTVLGGANKVFHLLLPPFDTEENCQAFIDSVGGSEAIKDIMRKWHGNH